MYKERDARVDEQVICLARFGVCGHDNDRRGSIWRGGEVGIVHEGDVRYLVMTCRQMKLRRKLERIHMWWL